MTSYNLIIQDDKREFEVYINTKHKIYIGERYDEDNPYGSHITIPIDDWQELKKFIDNEIQSLQNIQSIQNPIHNGKALKDRA